MPGSDLPPVESERSPAEATLREHDELFRLVTEHALDLIRLHDLDGRSIYNSWSVLRLFGRAPATLFDFAHPDDLAASQRWWQQVQAGEKTERLRWRVVDRDGNWHWLESAASFVRFQGKPHILTVCRDITERERAEQALRESHDHLEMVLNTLPVGVVVLDRTGDVILANPAAKLIWGEIIVSGPERWARSIGYWHDSGRQLQPDDWASARALFHGQTNLNELIDIETFDGLKKIVANSAAPLRDSGGVIVGAVAVNEDVTDRERAEAALRESERKLSEAERVAHLGYWENDLDANRVSWSDETARMLGLPDERGRTAEELRELVHPEDRHIYDEALARALKGEADHEVEFRVVRPDNEVRHIRAVVDLIRDETGRPRRAFGAIQDITLRKRAEEALRKSERNLNEAQRIAHLGHWEQDLNTGRITASDEAYRILGLQPHEDLRTWASWQEHVHPEDREIRAAAIERALHEGSRYEAEFRVVRPDGEIRIVHSQGETERDNSGRPRRIFGIVRDVTEHRSAEAARRAAEHRLEHVVASSPAILFTLQINDVEFRGIDWMSENVEALLGYRVDETLGPDWWMNNIHPEDRDLIANHLLSDILSGGHSAAEFRFRHRNGQFRWIRCETRMLRDAAGQPAEVVGSLSDITERKRLEDQFRQAQKMEAVGHLAAGVAHDFNNLLTIISGYSDILLPKLPPDDPTRDMVFEIREAGERAASLTRQLLAFSRQTVLDPKVLDLNELVRENEKMLRRLMGEDVQLATSLDLALAPVKVDPGQLGQVLMNLAVNARDAMPKGGRLTIETGNVTPDETVVATAPEARAGRYVLLAVTDTGVGMTPEVRARIFEPFFTTKEPGRGTGLGLATVYGIVRQSGGFVSVHSEPGQGTTFRIYFPVAAARVAIRASVPVPEPLARGTETILLVEDEEALRSILRTVLVQAGYTVLEASRGVEALRLAVERAGPIHLLITDVVMPEMGGRDLVERLGRERPGIRVLYLSGYTDDAVVRHGVLHAEVAFLQKPFTMAALTSKVRQVLDESPV